MFSARKNTLVIDFTVLPVRPDVKRVQEFLEKDVNIQYSDVESIQLHHSRNCVLVAMKSYDIVSRYQLENNGKRTMLCAGKEFRIPIYVDCDAVTIRIHDLPPEMSHSTVSDHMLKYGEVISIRSETWKHYFSGVPNGVRVLRMRLLQPIPPFITIADEKTMVSYHNQPQIVSPGGQPADPATKCQESSTTASEKSASTTEPGLFNPAEFPPINNNDRHKSPSAVPTIEETNELDDADRSEDDNTSLSSTEYNDDTHKRRRSMGEKEAKKVCADADQCCPNHEPAAHEEVLNNLSKGRNVTFKIKNGKGFNYIYRK